MGNMSPLILHHYGDSTITEDKLPIGNMPFHKCYLVHKMWLLSKISWSQ